MSVPAIRTLMPTAGSRAPDVRAGSRSAVRSHHQASLPTLESIEPDAIWHSDRGSVYTSADFQALVTSLGMRSSCENFRKTFRLQARTARKA